MENPAGRSAWVTLSGRQIATCFPGPLGDCRLGSSPPPRCRLLINFGGGLMRQIYFCLVILGIAANNGIADAATILDQSQLFQGASSHLPGTPQTHWKAQTFTVGVTGELVRIDMSIWNSGSTTGDLLWDLRLTDPSGLPRPDTGSLLLSGAIDSSLIPPPFGFISIDLGADSIEVVAGDVFAIAFHKTTPLGYGFSVSSGAFDAYAGGKYYTRDTNSGVWVPIPSSCCNDYDLVFQTFIDPTPVPEPSTALLLTCGLAGLAVGRRRRAI